MAFDIVGPFERAKGGYKHLLTSICLASRWPDAVPLRDVEAKTVERGMFEIMSRTGIPNTILTDQGSKFWGKVVRDLCRLMGVEQLKTSPYHPQCNGRPVKAATSKGG